MLDWKKFFSSFVQLVPWLKDIRTICSIVLIGFVGLTIYRAYIMPTNTQKQQTRITVSQGGTLNLQQTQGQVKERRWFIGPTVMVSKKKDFYVGGTILRSF